MTLFDTQLDDKFDLTKTRIYTSGTQALVRLCLMQAQIDHDNGLDTGGYISGYRGSPLGGLDLQFGHAKKRLTEAQVIFEAGLNEDIAATAIWGTQQAELRGDGKHDGEDCEATHHKSAPFLARRAAPPLLSKNSRTPGYSPSSLWLR